MFPIVFQVGPLSVYTYGVLVAAGFVVGIALALRLGRQDGIPRERILDIGLYLLISALIGARLLFVATTFDYYAEHPVEIFKIWEGGLVFYGGPVIAVPVLILYLKRHALPVLKSLDVLAPAVALGHAIGRIGCFSAGCCYGKPTSLPWGITFSDATSLAPTGISLHPTQLYESLAEAAIFLFLIVMRRHRKFYGQIIWTYVLSYSSARFLIEFFRGDEARGFLYNGLSVAQGISAVLFFIALCSLVLLSKRQADRAQQS